MKPRLGAVLFVLATLLCVPEGFAQVPLEEPNTTKVNRILDSLPGHDTLRCTIHDWKPFLDFSFRFDAGYIVHCPFEEFGGHESRIAAYTRVTPQGSSPVVLGDLLSVPAAPPEVTAKINLKKLHAELEISGGFAVGEGEYQVEVLVADNRNRFCRKRWNIKAERSRDQSSIPVALEAKSVSHLWPDPWDGKLSEKGQGYRVTILLDAAPMNPREAKLRVWDRAFLLQSLRSVLQHLPCESVRLVAFNLDQQKELFRQEHFDSDSFRELSRTLRNTELGTVSYQALLRGPQGVRFLSDLADRELESPQPSDVVIFIGPTSRFNQKSASTFSHGSRAPRFFYFEYFPFAGAVFPDCIQQLTSALQGTTYQIHSPAQFGKAMQRMVAQLDRERQPDKREAIPSLTPR